MERVSTVRGMSYPSDTDDRWELLEPVFSAPGKRGRKHADDLRTVVNAMLYVAPVVALVVPASTHENRASELMLEHLAWQGVTDWLDLVPVDRGVTPAARLASRGRSRSPRTLPQPDSSHSRTARNAADACVRSGP
jgi:hypothetical protein